MKQSTEPNIEIIKTPKGRSHFDAVRWRCRGEGETCGVWHSASTVTYAQRYARSHLALAHGVA